MPKVAELLDNPRAERVRRVADLAAASTRKKTGKFLIEGPQAVRELVFHRPDLLDDLYVASQVDPQRSIVAAALEAGAYVHEVSPEVLAHMSKDAQSILAVGHWADLAGGVDDLRRVGLKAEGKADQAADRSPVPALVAACWQVRDPGNAGTVIRTADAAGCAAVILVGDCVDPLNPKVIRASTGSLFHIPVYRLSEEEFFAWAAESGTTVWAADIHGIGGQPPLDLAELAFGPAAGAALPSPLALLFGNEARGLPADLVTKASQAISIPLYGQAESLNLAMSSAVLLYSLAMLARRQ